MGFAGMTCEQPCRVFTVLEALTDCLTILYSVVSQSYKDVD
jgi:hypothetical protein